MKTLSITCNQLITLALLIIPCCVAAAEEMSLTEVMDSFDRQRIGGLVVFVPTKEQTALGKFEMEDVVMSYMSTILDQVPMDKVVRKADLQLGEEMEAISQDEKKRTQAHDGAFRRGEGNNSVNVYFRFGSAEIDSSQIRTIQMVCAAISGVGGGGLELIGHSDSFGGRDYNALLSLKRALSVRRAIERECEMTQNDISVSGLGEESPLTRDAAMYNQNRRVEIRARPDIEMVMLESGQLGQLGIVPD